MSPKLSCDMQCLIEVQEIGYRQSGRMEYKKQHAFGGRNLTSVLLGPYLYLLFQCSFTPNDM